MNMPRNRFAVAAAFLTLAAGFIFMAGYAANAPMPPAVVGVVDLEKVYNNLDSREDLMKKVETMQAEMAEEASTMQDELEMLSAELESLAPGSAAMVEMNEHGDLTWTLYEEGHSEIYEESEPAGLGPLQQAVSSASVARFCTAGKARAVPQQLLRAA